MPSHEQDPREIAGLGSFESLRIDLDQHDEGAHAIAVEIPAAWVAEVLSETDAKVRSGGLARLEITLQSNRTVLVRGHLELGYSVPCARCLAPAEVDVGAETDELCVTFVPAERLRSWSDAGSAVDGGAGEDDIEPLDPSELDEIGYQGNVIDLRALISEQILLAYPMRALCSRGEACLGLCMRCGAELNDLVGDATERPAQCPSCGARLDGADDDGPETPWKRALAKVNRGGDST
jgi:uncharacterized metal-binding protein YceD (DUF177 family)